MNQEWKAKWIAALRSGKYTQAKNCLNDGTGMCCLGVACDVYDLIHWTNRSSIPDGKKNYYGESSYPPSRVTNAFGLESNNPMVTTNRDGNNLSLGLLNDSGEFSFDQIADLIQARL
jgi:hypothetical protein